MRRFFIKSICRIFKIETSIVIAGHSMQDHSTFVLQLFPKGFICLSDRNVYPKESGSPIGLRINNCKLEKSTISLQIIDREHTTNNTLIVNHIKD